MKKKLITLCTVIATIITMTSSFYVTSVSLNNKSEITKIQSTKPGKLTVKIKRLKNCSGYEIKLSTNKNFSKTKTYIVKRNKKIISGLRQGKKYYVKVRAYKKVKGKKFYGKWSKAKSMITKVNEKDKIRREQVKELTGINFSEDVKFIEYTRNEYLYEEYDNAVTYDIKAKIKIKKKELRRIIKENKFIKKPNSYMGAETQYNYNCVWWDLRKSQLKEYYHLFCSKKLTEYISIKTVSREIMVSKDKDKNGYITAYLVLQ